VFYFQVTHNEPDTDIPTMRGAWRYATRVTNRQGMKPLKGKAKIKTIDEILL